MKILTDNLLLFIMASVSDIIFYLAPNSHLYIRKNDLINNILQYVYYALPVIIDKR